MVTIIWFGKGLGFCCMVQYGLPHCVMVWYGKVWYGMVQYDMVLYGTGDGGMGPIKC